MVQLSVGFIFSTDPKVMYVLKSQSHLGRALCLVASFYPYCSW